MEDTKDYQKTLIKDPHNHQTALSASLLALQQNNMADAIQFMQQAAEIAPENAVYRRNLGELLRRAGQYEAAITTLNIAIDIEPYSAESFFLLGLVYNDIHQFELAIECYHRALSYNQNDGLIWNNLGASFESMGDKQTAKIAYATAIALNQRHAEAQNNLGAILSEEGRLDEARAHFTAAISVNSEFINAHYNLSLIKTYTLNDPHLDYLETIEEKMDQYPIDTKIHYYFALGKALDDTKQYDRAYRAYAKGNQLHYLQKPWNPIQLQNLVDNIPVIFTNSFLKKPVVTIETRCPIFIVGMPRAGTTLIEQTLSSHADIYGAGELSILDDIIHDAYARSPLPFNQWVKQLDEQAFTILGEKYLDQVWKLAPDKKFIIDKMPSNCFYIGMIYRMLPTAKIIHAIRDPMDSCFSCFTHFFKDGMYFSYDLEALGNYYILYAKAMRYWQSILPENIIFHLRYEQMVENHEEFSKQLLKYIGLHWDHNCLHFYENKRIVKTASLTQVRKPIYKTSIRRWEYFLNELAPLLQILSPYRKELAYENN